MARVPVCGVYQVVRDAVAVPTGEGVVAPHTPPPQKKKTYYFLWLTIDSTAATPLEKHEMNAERVGWGRHCLDVTAALFLKGTIRLFIGAGWL